jgi:signal transduction histidine kinase
VLVFNAKEVNRFQPDDVRVIRTLTEQIAIAVENARLFRETETARRRVEILSSVYTMITHAVDEDSLLAAFSPIITHFGMAYSVLGYFQLDEQGQPYTLRIVSTQDQNQHPMSISTYMLASFPVKDSRVMRYMMTHSEEPVFAEDIATHPLFDEENLAMYRQWNIKSVIVMPLKTVNNWQGLLYLDWVTPQVFDPEIRSIMTSLMPRLADNVAGRRAYLAQEAARNRVELLYRVSQEMNTAQSFPAIVEAMATYWENPAEGISLSIYENFDKQTATYFEVITSRPGGVPNIVAPHQRFPAELIQDWTHKGLFITEDTNDPPPTMLPRTAEYYRNNRVFAVAVAGLVLGERVIGALTFTFPTPRHFTPQEKNFMRALGDLAAAAVERTRLFNEQVQTAENLKEARREAELLYQISQSVNETTVYTQILDAFGTHAGPFDYDVVLGTFENYDRETANFTVLLATLYAGQTQSVARNDQYPVFSAPVDSQGTIIIEDVRDRGVIDERRGNALMQTGLMALLNTRIMINGRAVGSISFIAHQPRKFNNFERRLIRGLSDLAAAAVERSRLYEEQVQTSQRLREMDIMKSQFLASVSHELRTPLNAILNFSKFVSTGMLGPVNEKQVDALKKTIDSGRHLLSLINDVLDITKIESNMLNLFVESDVNIQIELETVLSTAETLLMDKPVQLIRNIPESLPLLVGDRRRIRQILLNIVANACKFTDSGSITVSAKIEDVSLLLAIKDTGPGIALEDQGLIFEAFRQTQKGLSHVGGTGLGLAIAKRLVEAHDGQLWLESTPPLGATFYVSLPIHSAALLDKFNMSRSVPSGE